MHFPALGVARATCRGCAPSGAGRKDKPLGSSSPGKKETKSAVVTPAEPLASCKKLKTENQSFALLNFQALKINSVDLYKKIIFCAYFDVKLFGGL